MSRSQTRDVLVVGAGPAGSALAYFLASNRVDVVLVDKSEFPRDKTCGDALSPRALHVLKKMGLSGAVDETGFRINRVKFLAPNRNRVTVRIPSDGVQPDYCVVLRRYDLDAILCRQALRAGAEFRPQTTVIDVVRDNGRVTGVRANSPVGLVELKARLTVLATGAATAVLTKAGFLGKTIDHCLAARTYYEHVQGLSDAIEFHYDGVPLPGYGWVFPVSETAANVGVGYHVSKDKAESTGPPSAVLERFLAGSEVSRRLASAERMGPVKGYPIRVDFPSAVPAHPGLILIGEAAGLVNPLSGEGIDYALESAELLADLLLSRAGSSRVSTKSVEEEYLQSVRNKFLPGFTELIRVRDVYMRPWMLNRYVSAAIRNEAIGLLLVNIGLGNVDPRKALTLGSLFQIARG